MIKMINKFPSNKELIIKIVQINFNYKYNLNTTKLYLNKLYNESNNSIILKYILFCLKQKEQILNKNNDSNNDDNEENNEKNEEIINYKFKKLKNLIEACSKLYNDFWEYLCSNFSNNLDIPKLIKIGSKLNKFISIK